MKELLLTTENDDNFLEGVFLQGNKETPNGRIYEPNTILNSILNSPNMNLFGEFNNGISKIDIENVNTDNITHEIINIRMKGNNGYAKVKLLKTLAGENLLKLVQNDIKLRFLVKGFGNITDNVVNNFILSGIDITYQYDTD